MVGLQYCCSVFWLREALKRYFVVETKEERILCTTSAAAIHIFMVRVGISFMHNALIILVPCCESNILFFFAQKISASVSSSAEICMCIGMQEYYVPGMVCRPCVLMMRSNLLNFFGGGVGKRVLSWFFHAWGEK